MDILQNLGNLFGNDQVQSADRFNASASSGSGSGLGSLAGALSPEVLGGLMGALLSRKSGGSVGGTTAGGMGGLGNILGELTGRNRDTRASSAPAPMQRGPGAGGLGGMGRLGTVDGMGVSPSGSVNAGGQTQPTATTPTSRPSAPGGLGGVFGNAGGMGRTGGMGQSGGLGGGLGNLAGMAGIGMLGSLLSSFLNRGSGATALAPQQRQMVSQINNNVPDYDDAPSSAPAAADDRVVRLITAMVFAAKADGNIDENEKKAIQDQVESLNAGPRLKNILQDAMNAPLDPVRLAKGVTSGQEALELYSLSCAMIDIDTPQERQYINSLATALGIPEPVKQSIESTIYSHAH
ncbi:MAG: tellurite resistance TerB family protein [Planctomycetes bacterium]|nr:tellurite resistance TerB family protein [Planctomycetota bacterium]